MPEVLNPLTALGRDRRLLLTSNSFAFARGSFRLWLGRQKAIGLRPELLPSPLLKGF
jgi:hypothetical protein